MMQTATGAPAARKGATMPDRPETTLPPAVATDPLALVTVAPDAIVSRTLHRTAGGNVTLFAFDRGQFLSEHTAPFDALVLVLDGSLELVIGGEPVHATAGRMVRMPADVPHGLTALEPSRMLLVMLREPAAQGS
jgi:quercetin dioxygenase-like cupin family protein